jgi:hypothetical protein
MASGWSSSLPAALIGCNTTGAMPVETGASLTASIMYAASGDRTAYYLRNESTLIDPPYPQVAAILEIDIWRAASLMLKRDGEKAFDESVTPAAEFRTCGS